MSKRSVGRPTKLTPSVQETITTALTLGATIEMTADAAGISLQTYYNWYNAGEAVFDRLQAEYGKSVEYEERAILSRESGKNPPERPRVDYRITREEKRYLEFFEAVKAASAMGGIYHLNNLRQHATRDPQISEWILERRFGYGRVDKSELSGPGGGPIETKDVSQMTIEDRAARILQILQAAQFRAADESNAGNSPDQ